MNVALPGPEREVLSLLVESGPSYDGIGELLGIDRQGVSEIAARARPRVAGAVAPASRRPHLAAVIDREQVASPDPGCPCCPRVLEAMRAADAAYRAWDPAAMPADVRERIRDRL